MIIKTDRLILRPWCKDDLEPFFQLNADPRVMEFFPSILSREESDSLANRISNKLNDQGWGLWAVAIPGLAEFIGFIGLAEPSFNAHFTPTIEIGWRLSCEFWGRGYATEGAKAALQYGFETQHLNEIVSFTTEKNIPSRRVMEKLGMLHDSKDDFDHPKLSADSELRRHVLYRLNRKEWESL